MYIIRVRLKDRISGDKEKIKADQFEEVLV
jgi:hypothetical protein